MKSAVPNSNDEIEVLEDPSNPWGRVRIRESQGQIGIQKKCSIFLTADQLHEHARECLVVADRLVKRASEDLHKEHVAIIERCTEAADSVVPEYRFMMQSPSCTSPVAKRWQDAWDGACVALGHDPKDFRR